jgi:hypothetical protein
MEGRIGTVTIDQLSRDNSFLHPHLYGLAA